jgi:hypothetical protein
MILRSYFRKEIHRLISGLWPEIFGRLVFCKVLSNKMGISHLRLGDRGEEAAEVIDMHNDIGDLHLA